MERAVYIKPMTWAGRKAFFIGFEPSDPSAAPCRQLGSYFICCSDLSSARAIAAGEARRLHGPVVECDHYVGY